MYIQIEKNNHPEKVDESRTTVLLAFALCTMYLYYLLDQENLLLLSRARAGNVG